jgi:hypothetical protein
MAAVTWDRAARLLKELWAEEQARIAEEERGDYDAVRYGDRLPMSTQRREFIIYYEQRETGKDKPTKYVGPVYAPTEQAARRRLLDDMPGVTITAVRRRFRSDQ